MAAAADKRCSSFVLSTFDGVARSRHLSPPVTASQSPADLRLVWFLLRPRLEEVEEEVEGLQEEGEAMTEWRKREEGWTEKKEEEVVERVRAGTLVIRDVWESHSNRNNLIGDSILLVILCMINSRDRVGDELGNRKGGRGKRVSKER